MHAMYNRYYVDLSEFDSQKQQRNNGFASSTADFIQYYFVIPSLVNPEVNTHLIVYCCFVFVASIYRNLSLSNLSSSGQSVV